MSPRRKGSEDPRISKGQSLHSTKQNEGTMICNWYTRLKFIYKVIPTKIQQISTLNKYPNELISNLFSTKIKHRKIAQVCYLKVSKVNLKITQ